MAFTAIGSLIAGAAVETAVVLAAITEVGIAMTVVGAVTGSKSLMKIGGVLSLVGGVGGMINGAMSGAASTAASVAEGAVPELLGEAGGYAAAAGESGLVQLGSELGSVAGVGDGTADVFAQADEAMSALAEQPIAADVAGSSAADATKAMGNSASPLEAVPEAITPKLEVPNVSEPLIGQSDTSLAVQGNSSNALDRATGVEYGSALPPAGSKDYFSNFMKWVKENKEVAKFGLEGIKGMVGSEKEDAMTDYYSTMADSKRYGNTVARVGRPLIGART